MEYPIERTESLDARPVVPATTGFTTEGPSAGIISTSSTTQKSGSACRNGAIQLAVREPIRKYHAARIRYAKANEFRKPKRSARLPPRIGRNQTAKPKTPINVPVCSEER